MVFDSFNSCILQAGLFVYDIFWVFFTPVMVSVAKSFDAPIKVNFLLNAMEIFVSMS
jgi:minor histocompatibility antigen H13